MTANDKDKHISGNANNDREPFGVPWRLAAWAGAVLLLLTAFVGTQVSAEVNWTVSDFVFAGVLLFGSLGTYEVAVSWTRDPMYRAGVAVALAGAFLLTWINAAVGITDTVADLAYLGVPVVGVVGALFVRFQARGMTWALLAMAVAQAVVPVFVLVAGMAPAHNPIYEILGINGIFVMLFVGSAFLFWTASVSGLERDIA